MTQVLRREMGLGGAIVIGLGSNNLGTGAFVAIGLASGLWGDAVLVAIPVAGAVAAFNGLSSAFLAGRFPVAGGTYEYGYRTLGPSWGFTAGWLFLLAKTASAAAAALGIRRVPRHTLGSTDIGGRCSGRVDGARPGRSQANDHGQCGPRHRGGGRSLGIRVRRPDSKEGLISQSTGTRFDSVFSLRSLSSSWHTPGMAVSPPSARKCADPRSPFPGR